MVELAFPPRRTQEGEQHDRTFIDILDAMLQDNDTITARAVTRRLMGIDHASSITRDPWRRARLAEWQARQKDMRRFMEQAHKRSNTNLATALEQKDARIRELEARVTLLTASHRAMIRAVGEMGGVQAWLKFFGIYQSLLDRLSDMGAIPKASVAPFPITATKESD